MRNEHWAKTRKIKKERKEKNIFLRVIYWILVIVFSCVVLYIFIFSDFVKVKMIDLYGTNDLKREKIYSEIKNILEKNFLWIFPGNNFFFVNQNRISDGLMDKFKKIQEVNLEKKFPNYIKINIKERGRLFLWCLEKTDCFVVDNNGYVIKKADFSSEFIKQNDLVRVDNFNSGKIEIGQKILEEEYINFIFSIRKSFKEIVNIETRDIYETRSRVSGDLIVTSPEGWKVYLNSEVSAQENAKILKIVLDKQISNQKRKSLEYIDLRSGSRVYYKIKREEKDSKQEKQEESGNVNVVSE